MIDVSSGFSTCKLPSHKVLFNTEILRFYILQPLLLEKVVEVCLHLSSRYTKISHSIKHKLSRIPLLQCFIYFFKNLTNNTLAFKMRRSLFFSQRSIWNTGKFSKVNVPSESFLQVFFFTLVKTFVKKSISKYLTLSSCKTQKANIF